MQESQPLIKKALITEECDAWLSPYCERIVLCESKKAFDQIIQGRELPTFDLILAPVGWWPRLSVSPWSGMGWRAVIMAKSDYMRNDTFFIQDCANSLQCCDDCIPLACDEAEILARIDAIKRRVSAGELCHITSNVTALNGRVRVDIFNRQVFVDDKNITRTFTRAHLNVLLTLAQSRDSATKAKLLDHYEGVIGRDVYDGKIIDVYICKIRRAFRQALGSDEEVIETLWGRGYKFNHDPYLPPAIVAAEAERALAPA
jgi:DNA-binding winged helix-turn-helix (wHTH) protein